MTHGHASKDESAMQVYLGPAGCLAEKLIIPSFFMGAAWVNVRHTWAKGTHVYVHLTSTKSKNVRETARCRLFSSSTTVICEKANRILLLCLSMPVQARVARSQHFAAVSCTEKAALMGCNRRKFRNVPTHPYRNDRTEQ